MGFKDRRVDTYIRRSPAFARPILERIRAAWHEADPEIHENIKWGIPTFEQHGIVGGMAAFQQHVSAGFQRGQELGDPDGILDRIGNSPMAGLKVTEVSELPAKTKLIRHIRRAVALDREIAALTPAERRRRAGKRRTPRLPAILRDALAGHDKAHETYRALPPGQKREYVDWIREAKRESTRARRVAQAVAWLAEGKSRNWKYRRS